MSYCRGVHDHFPYRVLFSFASSRSLLVSCWTPVCLQASVRRAKKAAARKDRAEGQQGGVATVPEGGQEGEQEEEEEEEEEEEDEEDDDEFWEDEEGTEVGTEAGTEEGADGRSEQSASAAAAGSAGAPAAGPSKTADSILRQLKQLR